MTTQVLYNNSYGDGFDFSAAFLAEYEACTGRKLDTFKALMRIGPQSIRCDPVAIAIFKEKGTEWCSGPTSELALREFSNVFDRYWEIEEQDGDEHVRLLVSEALADVLHEFMRTGDRVTLDRQYKAIVKAAAASSEYAPVVLKSEPADVISHVGFGYYDDGSEYRVEETKVDSGC
jgi:hypothetical protein